MGLFDQAARRAGKIDGAALVPWLLRQAPAAGPRLPPRPFRRWEDARRVPFPGDPDRTDDLVAELDGPFLLPIEMQTEPAVGAVERLAVYALNLRLEYRTGPGSEGLMPVGGILVNLTGTPPTAGTTLIMPGTADRGWGLRPVVVNLAEVDAAAELRGILGGWVPRCVLPWVPLMRGGGTAAVIGQWLELVRAETDEQQRLFAALAVTFAELTQAQVDWYRALEGLGVRESQFLLGIKREGMQEGELRARQLDLLELVRIRLADPVPEDVRRAVQGTTAVEVLSAWFRTAAVAASLAELRAVMRVGVPEAV